MLSYLLDFVKSQSPSCVYAPLKYWQTTKKAPQSLLHAEQAQLP